MTNSVLHPKVSVIIPVYNTEAFVKEAITSIMRQTLSEIEIIIINDGSTNKSLQIINHLAEQDQRIKVYSQNNQGLSSTRNRGIKLASGSYIYFMDSDDFLESKALEACLTKCETYNLDFVFFDADFINLNEKTDIGIRYNRKQYTDETSIYKGIDILNSQLDKRCYNPTVWLNFIQTDYIRKNNLSFLPGIIHEDQLFTCLLYLQADRVMSIHKNFFKRRLRENSIMKQHFSKKNMQCYFIVSDHLIRFASENPIVRNTIDKYLFQMLNTAAWLSYKLPWEDRWFIANQYLRKYKRYISIRNLLILLFKRLITA